MVLARGSRAQVGLGWNLAPKGVGSAPQPGAERRTAAMRKWLHVVTCPGLATRAALLLLAQSLSSVQAAPATQLYVTSQFTRSIIRYDGTDGSFIDSFGGDEINDPLDLIHGIDGHLLLSNGNNDNILS